ncbi:MAG TPA: acyltransferase family protein [Acidimicrobiales bacterium]|jgi:peptidoglycan/LPS O-acetylase OafA/YrhL|nr:acyltransferase family protein [Acidimicrobiales bacterium]
MNQPNQPAHRARPSATGKDRINALDGLRAFALLIIMGYHFGLGWLQGGYFSLDIFYVLSGYLITGLLLSEYRKRGRIKLSAFWLRRARRLLPALLIVLVVVALVVRLAEPTGLYPDLRMSSLSALFYFSNWWQIASSGNYFVATGAVYPLTHTWSLAVEEQFYLVWPLVAFAVMHFSRVFARGVRVLLVLSVAGAVGSALEMAFLYSPTANITRLYFGTDTHAQSILVGSVLACSMTIIQMRRGNEGMAPAASSPSLRRLLILLGLAGFAGTLTLTYSLPGTAAFDYRGGFMLSALSAAAIIIAAVCVPSGMIARFLSLRVLVWLGTISYGGYLWHYPVFIYLDEARTGLTGISLLIVRFATTFALAAASYYLVERPVMYGVFWRSLKAVGPSAALMVGTVAVVVVGTIVPATATVHVNTAIASSERQALVAVGAYGAHPVRFMLVGDSLADTLGVGLKVKSVSRFGVRVINRETLGCDIDNLKAIVGGVVYDPVSDCRHWRTLWPRYVAQSKPDVVGLLIGRWDITDHLENGHVVHIGQTGWDNHLYDEINLAVKDFSAHGAKVVLFTMPDIAPQQEAANGTPFPENDPVRVTEFNAIINRVARSNSQTVAVVDLNKILDPKGKFQVVVDGTAVRWPDGIHISKPGGEWLQPFVLPTVAQLGLTARAAAPGS